MDKILFYNTYSLHGARVLPAQLTGLQLVKKFPAFHGTRRFITALTTVRHLSLSWASQIQYTYQHPTSWRSILIHITEPVRFITALTTVRHLSLSWASPIQSTYQHPTSWRSILIHITEPEVSLPHSQASATCLYPGSVQSSPHTHIPPPGDPS